MPDQVQPAAASPPGGPSPGIRSLISYLIFIHFFFLLVGIKSNTASSGLDQDLRSKVPGLRQYLQLAAMDLSYMFHLTYYDGFENFQDTDYFVEADIRREDGTTETIKPNWFDLVPRVRARRYERLTFRAGVFAGTQNENLAGLIPHAIARRLLLLNNARELTLRIRRRLLQNLMLTSDDPRYAAERARSPDDASYFQTMYEARAYMNDEGEVSIAQIKAASDTAAPQGTPPAAVPTPSAAVPSATPTATGPRLNLPTLTPSLVVPTGTNPAGGTP